MRNSQDKAKYCTYVRYYLVLKLCKNTNAKKLNKTENY